MFIVPIKIFVNLNFVSVLFITYLPELLKNLNNVEKVTANHGVARREAQGLDPLHFTRDAQVGN